MHANRIKDVKSEEFSEGFIDVGFSNTSKRVIMKWDSEVNFPTIKKEKTRCEHILTCANLFGIDPGQFLKIFNEEKFINYKAGYSGALLLPYYDKLEYEKHKELGEIGKRIFDYIKDGLVLNSSRIPYDRTDAVCVRRYQQFGILDKNKNFGSFPHVYSYIPFGKNVQITLGTLAYKFWDLPIEKKFIVDFPNYTNEVMRFSLSSTLQTVDFKDAFRMEYLPENIFESKEDKSGWEDAKFYEGNYYRAINVRKEVGRILFKSLVQMYRGIYLRFDLGDIPDVRLDTHKYVIDYFCECLDLDIFIRVPGALLNYSKIDEQSLLAYKKWGFRLYEIPKKFIVPEKYEGLEKRAS